MRGASEFGQVLRARRLAVGLTQESLAERAGVSQRAISELERGVVRAPRRDTLEMLADALDLPPGDRYHWRQLRRQLSVRNAPTSQPIPGHAGLPLAPNLLIGRDRDIRELTDMLQRPDVRLVTVTGPGGVGKTRVALESGQQLERAFSDGVVFVDLATIRDPALVPPAVAHQLGLRVDQDQDIFQRLGSHLSRYTVLVILDNFEHLLPAASDVARLLQLPIRSKFLVTSRARLRIQAEREYPLTSLQLPGRGQELSFDEIGQFAAVQLFVERARQVKPGFRLTPENASDVLAICAHLNGLPLAIELAAARIKLLTPRAILPRLAHCLAFLTGGFHDWPDRHRTMRGAISWSYELLDPAEQQLLNQLATFVGGWSLEGVEKTNPVDSDVVDGLAALIDNSLILPLERPEGEIRFGMLETIREFGLERLAETGELARAREAHARYCLELAEAAEPHLRGLEQDRWCSRVGMELANVRAALEWADHDGIDNEFGLRLSGALTWFWFLRGHVSEGLRWLRRALSRATDPTKPRMKALAGAGWLAHWQHDSASARDFLMESLSISREVGDDWFAAWSLHALGRVAYFDYDSSTARALGEQSQEIARAVGDDWLTAWTVHLLGLAAYIDGDFQAARAHYESSLAIRRRINDQPGIAIVMALLALIAYREGDDQTALALLREGLLILHRLSAHFLAINGFSEVVLVAIRLNELSRAARLSGFVAEARGDIGAGLIPIYGELHQEGLEIVRQMLSANEFAAAWNAGTRMTLDEAMAEALKVGSGSSDIQMAETAP